MFTTKNIFIAFLALLALFFVYKIVTPSARITNYPSSNTGIVAFGDSLVAGVGSTEENDFVALLTRKIGQPIVNLGISGNTTAQGLARINEVTSRKPKVVLVLLGGNDYLQKVPKETTQKNLETIIKRIQESGAVVVLLGIRGGLLTDPYASMFGDLSARLGTFYVPDVLDGLIGDSTYMSDTVHPNNAGYERIAEKIYPVLSKANK